MQIIDFLTQSEEVFIGFCMLFALACLYCPLEDE